jgi:ATP-dependent Clp protease ATP-binding subunit ClpB
MQLDKLTLKSQEALADAQRIARELSHQEMDGEHLLLALLGHHRANLRGRAFGSFTQTGATNQADSSDAPRRGSASRPNRSRRMTKKFERDYSTVLQRGELIDSL